MSNTFIFRSRKIVNLNVLVCHSSYSALLRAVIAENLAFAFGFSATNVMFVHEKLVCHQQNVRRTRFNCFISKWIDSNRMKQKHRCVRVDVSTFCTKHQQNDEMKEEKQKLELLVKMLTDLT